MKRTLIRCVFDSDICYEYVDDPSEGPVYIIEYHKYSDFNLTNADKRELLFYHDPQYYPENYLVLRNMILDFDSRSLKVQCYVQDKPKDLELQFKDMK